MFTLAAAPGALAPALVAGARDAAARIDMNRHEGVLWFKMEAFESVVAWLYFIAILVPVAGQSPSAILEVLRQVLRAAAGSGYRVEKLLDAAKTDKVEAGAAPPGTIAE